ncbi:SUMF1/EgtB/PvdO family nonheme iron enzyme [uncultured Roseibium sp.]|uniref:SUMF1/EgtB/PvdO family nonheme iron enzyme n=1 Tax=uncultured Roseibium sp. TaxID=1936171 RepID=UPI003217BF25
MSERDQYKITGDYVAGDKIVNPAPSISVEEKVFLRSWPQLELFKQGRSHIRQKISDSPFYAQTTDMVASCVSSQLELLFRPIDQFEAMQQDALSAPVLRNQYAVESLGEAVWVNFVGRVGQGKSWLLRQIAIQLSHAQLGEEEFSPFMSEPSFVSDGDIPIFVEFSELLEEYKNCNNLYSSISAIYERKISQGEVVRQLLSKGKLILICDDIPSFVSTSSEQEELLNAIAIGMQSQVFRGIITSSLNEIANMDALSICGVVDKYLLPPNYYEIAKIACSIWGGDRLALREKAFRFSDRISKPLYSNLRFINAAVQAFDTSEFGSISQVGEILDALLVSCSQRSVAKGFRVSPKEFSDILERTSELVGGLKDIEFIEKVIVKKCIREELAGIDEETICDVCDQLIRSGILLELDGGEISFSDKQFYLHFLARRLIGLDGARTLIKSLVSNFEQELIELASVVCEYANFETLILTASELGSAIQELSENGQIADIQSDFWILVSRILKQVKEHDSFREEDYEYISVCESEVLKSAIHGSSLSLAIRARIAENHQPLTDQVFQFVPIDAGTVDLGDMDEELFEVDYNFFILKFPMSEFEYTLVEDPGASPRRKQYPITNISWVDVSEFCQKHSQKILELGGISPDLDYVLRLPTEAEWKLAFRGSLFSNGVNNVMPRRKFPWGNDIRMEAANTPMLLAGRRMGLMPTGLSAENSSPFGVVDMLGNCMEWCKTAWGGTNPNTPAYGRPYDPNDGREKCDQSDFRLALGGSWMFDDAKINCACRLSVHAMHPDLGFRPVAVPRLKC